MANMPLAGLRSDCLQPVKEMVDSTLLFKRGDAAGLYARLTDQGYLLLRDVLPRAKVLEGYKRILQHLQKLKGTQGRHATACL